jgi:hypothetical protein
VERTFADAIASQFDDVVESSFFAGRMTFLYLSTRYLTISEYPP